MITITSDELKIETLATDEKGNLIKDPEALPARRELGTAVPASTRNDGIMGPSGTPLGLFRGRIVHEGTVADFAEGLRHTCSRCVHFDKPAWLKLLRAWKSTLEGQAQLNGIRNHILVATELDMDEDQEVDHVFGSLGICHPWTEISKEPLIAHPATVCPKVDNSGHPVEQLFKPRDRASNVQSNAEFDAVMREAVKGVKV